VVHDLECAPDETFVVEPQDGVLVHSNHWLSPIARAKLRETGIADSPCSFFRQQRAERLLAPHARIGSAEIKAVLADKASSPLSICVPPRASSITGRTATVASLMMMPAEGVMDVAMMPTEGVEYTRYALSSDVAAEDRRTVDA
jgi:isopenicillin-N N-acyltransferase-like protein